MAEPEHHRDFDVCEHPDCVKARAFRRSITGRQSVNLRVECNARLLVQFAGVATLDEVPELLGTLWRSAGWRLVEQLRADGQPGTSNGVVPGQLAVELIIIPARAV
jgi:hypothetical protein